MRITQQLAKEISFKVTQPLRDNVTDLSKERAQLVTDVVKKKIPAEVLDMYSRRKEYFEETYSVKLQGVGISSHKYYSLSEPMPYPTSTVEVCKTDAKKFVKLSDKISDAKVQAESTENELYQTLLSLRTVKNVLENMPELKELLPQSKTQALVVPVDNIKKKIAPLLISKTS